MSFLAYITLSLPLSTYHNHYLYHNAPIIVSLSKCHNHCLYHNVFINVTMPQSLSHCINIFHTISICTCLKYIPRNNHPSISFGSLLPPFTHLGHVAEIFKSLGVSLGASLKSRLSPCSWLLRLGSTPNEAKGGRPY